MLISCRLFLAVLFLGAFWVVPVWAAGGITLDATFDGDGLMVDDVSGGYADTTWFGLLQQDEKIVAMGGMDEAGGGTKMFVSRYLSDGSVDNTFGDNGAASTHLPAWSSGFADAIYWGVQQQDNKILVAGQARTDFVSSYEYRPVLIRYLEDGQLDSSFGQDGVVVNGMLSTGGNWAVTLAANGDILVTGMIWPDQQSGNLFLSRYDANGSLVGSFGDSFVGTSLYTDFPPSSFGAGGDVIELADGKILVGGNVGNSHILLKYTANGYLDTSFGNNGITEVDIGQVAESYDILVLSNGKILQVGKNSSGFTVIRYLADGTLDPTFGVNGVQVVDFGASGFTMSAKELPQNKLLIAGYAAGHFALAYLNEDGSLYTDFGTGGKEFIEFPGVDSQGVSLMEQSDGKLVLVGRAGDDVGIARFTMDEDGDGINYPVDNCSTTVNVDQTDTDLDGYGDACDEAPNDSSDYIDTDGDGIGNNGDWDDDNDGVPDTLDKAPLDPLNNEEYKLEISGSFRGVYMLDEVSSSVSQ